MPILAFAVVFLILCGSADAGPQLQLRFSEQSNGGNCGECSWVLVEGGIAEGDTRRLEAFLSSINHSVNLRFNSPGGDVLEALRLGELIRRLGLDTFVGEETVVVADRKPHTVEYLDQESICYSACVYAFAGGVRRHAESGSVAVHQFYRKDNAVRPFDKVLSARDMAQMQYLTGVLSEYVREMGVSPRLVSMASMITPWQDIHKLSATELHELNLDNTGKTTSSDDSNWQVQARGDGAVAVSHQTQDGAGRSASIVVGCLGENHSAAYVSILTFDSTRDYGSAFNEGWELDAVSIELNGKSVQWQVDRDVGPVKTVGPGVGFGFKLSAAHLKRLLMAKSAKITVWLGAVAYRQFGEIGGEFEMNGAARNVGLALRNCR